MHGVRASQAAQMTMDRVRVAFVGLGAFTTELAEASQRAGNIAIASCYARTPETRERFAKQFGCLAAGSFEALCNDPTLQAVVLATPNDLHFQQTVALAATGKHVFVEKPLCNTIDEARKMVSACEAAGVVLAVGHQERRGGVYRRLRQMIQSGDFGTVHSFQASQCGNLIGKYGPHDWRFQTGQGVGPLHHKGIHKIDLLHHLFGPIVGVTTVAQPLSFNPHMHQTTVTCLRFASGLVGSLHSGFCYNDHHLNVFGERMMAWYDGHGRSMRVRDPAWEFHDIQVEPVDTLVEEMREFGEAVLGRGSVEVDGRAGAEAVAVAEAAVLAEQRRAEVRLDQVRLAGWNAA